MLWRLGICCCGVSALWAFKVSDTCELAFDSATSGMDLVFAGGAVYGVVANTHVTNIAGVSSGLSLLA